MRLVKSGPLALLISAFLIFSACKKDKSDDNPVDPPEEVSLADRLKDTAVLMSREIYLWNKQIPAAFNPRTYAGADAIMQALRAYSKEPGFAQPVDRWSFAVDKASWDDVSGGVGKDFGFEIFFMSPTDLRVKLVEARSPAGLAGVRRGWRLVSINGNRDINTSQASVNFIIANVYQSASSTIIFRKPDGNEQTINLTAASYQTNPIFLDSVYTVASKRVGYLAFNSFLGDTAQISRGFATAFGKFAQQNINEMVVDLRYNGGGYVSVQDQLANYLVPASGNGDIMMRQEFNADFSDWNEVTRFSKIGSLNLSRIFFIVGGGTASASELLINNLAPFVDVKVVGPEPSYGKPVGYFPIPLGNDYIFPISFRSTNKAGMGNYFNGFVPDKVVADGLDKDWGDRNEACLAAVLGFLERGNFGYMREIPGAAATGATRDQRVLESNRRIDAPKFKGMVDTRVRPSL